MHQGCMGDALTYVGPTAVNGSLFCSVARFRRGFERHGPGAAVLGPGAAAVHRELLGSSSVNNDDNIIVITTILLLLIIVN